LHMRNTVNGKYLVDWYRISVNGLSLERVVGVEI